MAPNPGALRATPLSKLKKLDRKTKPIVCSDVKRRTWLIDRNDGIVEIVLDSGNISAGDQSAPLHELELELKCGKQESIFELARELGQAAPIHVGVLSKYERGLMLADGAFDRAQKASTVQLRNEMTVGQAFEAIVHGCIRQFRLNEALIIAERDPDALHQARVAIRRLRTAFSLFRPAVRQGSLAPLREELREFIRPFGEARNLDVFLESHEDQLGRSDRRKLKSARAGAYHQVIDSLEAQQTRDMLLDLVEWTASGDWRKQAASGPIGPFATQRLEKAWRTVRRKGKGLSDDEERQLHRLRIRIKKLRYTVDFLAPLYGRKRVRNFSSSLEKMQDCLGLIHDDMINRQIVSDYELSEVARTDITRRSGQLRTMVKGFSRLKQTPGFWAG
jgi:inorganic triphosphatase YgiF